MTLFFMASAHHDGLKNKPSNDRKMRFSNCNQAQKGTYFHDFRFALGSYNRIKPASTVCFIIRLAIALLTGEFTKQTEQLVGRLKNHILPKLAKLPVSDIQLKDVEVVLRPIWDTSNDTAGRVRRIIEDIIAIAKTRWVRETDNPARWKGFLEQVLTNPNAIGSGGNQPALEIEKLPGFWCHLRKQESIASLALQYPDTDCSKTWWCSVL